MRLDQHFLYLKLYDLSKSILNKTRNSIIISCFLLYGCSENYKVIEMDNTLGKTFNVQNREIMLLSDSVLKTIKNVSIINFVPKETIILSGDNEIIEAGEKLVLIDRTLDFALIIDSLGSCENLGFFGAQKGGYLSVESVQYDSKKSELLLYSSEKKGLLKYDLNGKFKTEIKLDFFGSDFKLLTDNNYAFFVNQNESNVSKKNNLLITNQFGNVISRGYNWGKLSPVSFAYSGGFSIGTSTLFSIPFCDSLYEITSDKADLKYIISFANKTMPYHMKSKLYPLPSQVWSYNTLKSPLVVTRNYLSITYNDNYDKEGSIINNKSGKYILYSEIKKKFPLNLMFYPSGSSYNDDYFYSIINMSSALSHLKKYPEKWLDLKAFDENLYQKLKTSKIEDNSLIIKYNYIF